MKPLQITVLGSWLLSGQTLNVWSTANYDNPTNTDGYTSILGAL